MNMMENNETITTTPIGKILRNLNLNSSTSSSEKSVVILMDGSFNPIHIQHVDNFEIAKKEIEKKGEFKVVAGYISHS